MADGATWMGQPITLAEFMEGGGVLLARCGSPNCRTLSVVDERVVMAARLSSVPRLENAVRCSCGMRWGFLQVWRGEAPPPVTNERCYLFEG